MFICSDILLNITSELEIYKHLDYANLIRVFTTEYDFR